MARWEQKEALLAWCEQKEALLARWERKEALLARWEQARLVGRSWCRRDGTAESHTPVVAYWESL